MPYQVKKAGAGYSIINKDTGKTVGHSSSKAKAESSVRARLAGEHGWKGTKKK
jgi:hypothetical protein